MTTPVGRAEQPWDGAPTPVSPLDGHLLRIIAGGRPSPRTAATSAARHRESRYRRFLDALGVALYTTDAAGRITFFNEAAATFWGRRPALGEPWCGSYRLYHADGRPMAHDECPMAVALRERREVRDAEAIAERPDGSRVTFVPYPTPLFDDRGRLVGAVNVLVDVTERRRVEDALRRTAEALATSNAVKDEFLGLVSHELRTPVTTIFGNARLLRDRGDRLDEDVRTEMIGDIADDAERLHQIVENLLQLTRLGSGQQPELEPQVIDLVVRRAIESFRRRRPRREIRFSRGRSGAIVEADATWLELVVDNLLANADKYSPADQPIEVVVAPGPDEVEVAVLDRGIGFGDALPDELFQPFYRTKAARKVANGVGIGLAVCRRIVETLGGRITAGPREGGGSEVAFVLPRAAETDLL